MDKTYTQIFLPAELHCRATNYRQNCAKFSKYFTGVAAWFVYVLLTKITKIIHQDVAQRCTMSSSLPAGSIHQILQCEFTISAFVQAIKNLLQEFPAKRNKTQ